MAKTPKYPAPPEPFVNPSILSADFANLAAALRSIERQKCEWVHIDVMDGHFVPNITIGPGVVKSLRAANKRLFFDVHLMIDEPMKFSKEFVEAGADLITVHAETCELDSAIRALKRRKVQVGVCLKPDTPVEEIEPFLGRVDLVLIMSVEPGFGGQSLIGHTLGKVRQLALLRQQKRYRYKIEIDGGINADTIGLAAAAGTDILVAGSAVFKGGKVADNLRVLRAALKRR